MVERLGKGGEQEVLVGKSNGGGERKENEDKKGRPFSVHFEKGGERGGRVGGINSDCVLDSCGFFWRNALVL